MANNSTTRSRGSSKGGRIVRPLGLRIYPDTVLREVCCTVERFDGWLADVLDEMLVLMRANSGIGLAGPQVGITQRLFVSEIDGKLVYTDHHTKYGLDLIDKNLRTKIVSFTNLPAEQVFVIDGSLILWNENEVEELRQQGNSIPKLNDIVSEQDTLLKKIGFYDVYQIRKK